jgi:hypothetical protein
MKVQGKVSRTQTIEGSISKAELLALVRETMNIPEGAVAVFSLINAEGPGYFHQQIVAGGVSPLANSSTFVTEQNPLRFHITWSLPVGKAEQG